MYTLIKVMHLLSLYTDFCLNW